MGICGSGQEIGQFFFNNNWEHVPSDDTGIWSVPQLEEQIERQVREVFRQIWWVQDSASVHRLLALRDRLREVFGGHAWKG